MANIFSLEGKNAWITGASSRCKDHYLQRHQRGCPAAWFGQLQGGWHQEREGLRLRRNRRECREGTRREDSRRGRSD